MADYTRPTPISMTGLLMGENQPSESQPFQTFQVPQTKSREAWAIVVAGAMDPRQHHPFWYRMIGVLTESEEKRVTGHLMPVQAHFSSPDFVVDCTPERWAITTFSRDHLLRIQQVAAKVFQKLNEVPVSAFGVNATMHRTTEVDSVGELLARRIAGGLLDISLSGKPDCSLTFSDTTDGSRVQAMFGESTLGDNILGIDYNAHHQFKGDSTYIDLGEEIRKHADADWKKAALFGDNLTDRLNRIARD